MASQCLHLGSFGRAPRKGQPRWSCIGGVTSEGARAPHASRHIPFPVEPKVLHGISPIEAGRIAEERARIALDATGRRKLRRDGIALLAGVVSYFVPRMAVDEDPVDQDIYYLWRSRTLAWLLKQFGDHLQSVVEHRDESFYHLHFYVVPILGPRNRLNVNQLHPGRYAKAVAEVEGADHKNAERSYRQGMRAWQDDYHRSVSAFFHHDRYGPRRARVSRREREMQLAMEAERARMLAEIETERVEAENAARRRGLERYALPYENLQRAYAKLEAALATEAARRRAAEAEVPVLRDRLAALEEAPSVRFEA